MDYMVDKIKKNDLSGYNLHKRFLGTRDASGLLVVLRITNAMKIYW